jgi:hypothetical protein
VTDSHLIINPEALKEAASILSGEADPPEWLVRHFERVVILVDQFYASGYGRIQRSAIKVKLEKLETATKNFHDQLDDWGDVFVRRGKTGILPDDIKTTLFQYLELIAEEKARYASISSGKGEAAFRDTSYTIKELFALGVFLASLVFDKGSERKSQEDTLCCLWGASRLADPKLYEKNWAGVVQVHPGNGRTWTKSLIAARKIRPQRDESGHISATFYDIPLCMSGAEIASFWILTCGQLKKIAAFYA